MFRSSVLHLSRSYKSSPVKLLSCLRVLVDDYGKSRLVHTVGDDGGRRNCNNAAGHLVGQCDCADRDDKLWYFGFGANMNKEHVESCKGCRIFFQKLGILKGHRLVFNVMGIPMVEPSFASVLKGEPGDEVHGVVSLMVPEDHEKLVLYEVGYYSVIKEIICYDGEKLEASVLFNKAENRVTDQPPSQRYIDVMVEGAIEAGLDSAYVNKLLRTPTYRPSEKTLGRRKEIPHPDTLPEMSWNDLKSSKWKAPDVPVRNGFLGYVIEDTRPTRFPEAGQELTLYLLNWFRMTHYHGDLFKRKDVLGLKALVSEHFDDEEREYMLRWMDNFICNGEFIGYLKEFKEAGFDLSWVLERVEAAKKLK